jgi:hypothetical protein
MVTPVAPPPQMPPRLLPSERVPRRCRCSCPGPGAGHVVGDLDAVAVVAGDDVALGRRDPADTVVAAAEYVHAVDALPRSRVPVASVPM